ncbi:receptor-like protein EIX2 [Bidens hawaiensis]|uniref:receptor-like protein EIX2 n=1 Tax=Bidens hawaiensis TaxID=980011 RepID=UPI0040496A38
METSFLVILFLTILIFQRFGTSSNTMIMASSNVTCIEMERRSLLVFKQSLKDRFNLLSTWSGVECCEWRGVRCDSRNGHVVKLDLRSRVSLETIMQNRMLLEGELSPSLQNLKHLRYLDLSMNGFSGNIPEFLGSFKRLEYLNLSRSGFDGVVPHHLGNLSRVQYLDLRNSFDLDTTCQDHTSGTRTIKFAEMSIMDDLRWVFSLSSLRHLDLSGITIGKNVDWFHPINMLTSLLTLNLAYTNIDIPSIKVINFTPLNSLDLSINGISPTIPIWLSNLTSLVHLNLYFNDFHDKIPDFLGTFNAIASIDLSSNSFDTSMPDMLSNLSSLIHLRLSRNMFSGPIPENLGLLLRIEDLYLNNNQLSGNIPMSLGQLSKLKNLDLSHNSLVGVLSETHFTKLNNLNYLTLSSNPLALNFNSRWIPPFQLQMLLASSCNIGPHFPNWLQAQTNLQTLDLSNSSIRDTIQEWFETILFRILELDLSNNQISGKLPRFLGGSSNKILKMNSNKFEGSLATFPSNVKYLDLSDNLLSGYVPQTNGTMNPSIEVIYLSKNRFTGSVPVCFCKVPSIQILDLSQNKFSGRLPGCLGNLINLTVIVLKNNNISGVVPSSMGSLKNLCSLHFRNNRFEGDIPASLQNLTNLVTMDLGNNLFTSIIPSWIGEELCYLQILNLESNKFTENIPLQICQLNYLQYLNLAHNNITGTIPRCFGYLSGMMTTTLWVSSTEYYRTSYEENILAFIKGMQLLYTKTIKFLASIDLSKNNIVGEIPDSLTNLVGLRNLNLSGNLLEGRIPMMIGDLKQLESLDLSMNKLSGWIPQSLTSLNFLGYLNLSFNNLSGPIPAGTQIQTLDDLSFYRGNNGLCGPPILRSCNANEVLHNHVDEDVSEDDTVDVWFYAGMRPRFVVGFMVLLGTLENVYGWLMVSLLLNLASLRRNVSNEAP